MAPQGVNGPHISIVMPVFNTGAALREAIESVRTQSLFAEERPDYWELLVVDDGSTDEQTLSILSGIQALAPNIRVLPNHRRKGVAGARNTGLHGARGDWIGFLDSDDVWYPGFLEGQRNAFEGLPEAQWRAAHFHVGDDAAKPKLRPLAERSPCLYQATRAFYDRTAVARLSTPVDVLLDCGCMQVMTVQVARDILLEAGGFDEAFPAAEDYDLWIRLAVEHDLYISPLDAGVYRVRSGSLTKSGRPMYFNEDRMLLKVRSNEDFARFIPAIDRRLAKVYLNFCHHFRKNGDFVNARRFAKELIRLSPFDRSGWRQMAAATARF